ncbi:MAG: amino acid ABC transporter permease [Rhodospirillaceae bacterium]|jgi:general L-amino acid transport system permease protein|nr:amino acid ABC transporter permease [Rhodospirillaceae bacterium]
MEDTQRSPDLAPPSSIVGPVGWLRANLFSSPANTVLSLVGLYIVYVLFVPVLDWAFFSADWIGTNKDACSSEGACWVFVGQRMDFFIYGFYPKAEYWRINVIFVLLAAMIVPQMIEKAPYKEYLGWFFLIGFPIISGILLLGGIFGLDAVPTDKWGGLMLTLVISFVGIIAALPIGILLALGRRSEMPVIRIICTAFIELWRGVPLISVLFMASVMLPLFLPEGTNFNKLLRALIGIVMFQSAYMAEVIRGGLQAIPKGQYEAAAALGLGYWKSMGLVILPQALKLVIPGIVNTFIALFKDTTLVLIIGLFDVLQTVSSAIVDPAWPEVSTEGFVFAAFVFWVFCFSMSRYSINLERKLHTGHKR